MATIQKRADELKRGDVVTDFLGATTMLCPAVVVRPYKHGEVRIHDSKGATGTIMIGYAQDVEVESPDLTPAQQHADELLDALETVMDCDDSSAALYDAHRTKFRELLAKIKPPELPTLEEALAELEAICNSHDDESEYAAMQRAGVLLDRARRSGLLK